MDEFYKNKKSVKIERSFPRLNFHIPNRKRLNYVRSPGWKIFWILTQISIYNLKSQKFCKNPKFEVMKRDFW
jgi:hypothetical protein